MPFIDSARKQFLGVAPTPPTAPDVVPHLQGILDAIEEHVILRAATWAEADTLIAPYIDGMLLFVDADGALYLRLAGAWKKIYPTNFSGTTDPAPSLGSDGDLYFQTIS